MIHMRLILNMKESTLKIELYIRDKGIFQYIMMALHTMHRHGKPHIQKIKSIGGMQSPIVITNFWTGW